jgi:hypothetical protein
LGEAVEVKEGACILAQKMLGCISNDVLSWQWPSYEEMKIKLDKKIHTE